MEAINHTLTVVDESKVKERVKKLAKRSSETQARIGYQLKALWNPIKPLANPPELTVFDDLLFKFPNFEEVINYVKMFALAQTRSQRFMYVPPFLLAGEPGLGKTYFTSQLAKALGVHYGEISMTTVTSSMAIAGGNIQWADAEPGFVLKEFCLSETANPFFVIDELDKSMRNGNYPPLGPIFNLLEQHSAKRFKDEYLDIPVDVSNVIWCATANDVDNIPLPILSRLKKFDIENIKKSTCIK